MQGREVPWKEGGYEKSRNRYPQSFKSPDSAFVPPPSHALFFHRFPSTQHNLAVHCDYFWPFPSGLWHDFHIPLLGWQLEPIQPCNGHYHPWGRCKQLFQLHVSAVPVLLADPGGTGTFPWLILLKVRQEHGTAQRLEIKSWESDCGSWER